MGARQQSEAGEGMGQERAWSRQSSDAMRSQIKDGLGASREGSVRRDGREANGGEPGV